MNDDFDRDPMADALRASLARHADEAPNGDALAERIVSATGQASATRPVRHNAWRTWTLPLVAAAAVGAVVLSVVGIESYHPATHKTPAAVSGSAPTTATLSSAPVSPTAAPSSTRPPNVADLQQVRILDLTFVGENDGYALASARCMSGPGRCTALLRTTDGTSWHSMPGPQFNVAGVKNCAAPCVNHLRFANEQIGYAFGPDALLMTTDGGRHWIHEQGLGATALESFNGNVIRAFSTTKGCPPACTMQVATAPNGGPSWTTATLPGTPYADGVQVSRSGSSAYVLLTRNPAAGAGTQTSALYRSLDDGRSWTSIGEPCPQAGVLGLWLCMY